MARRKPTLRELRMIRARLTWQFDGEVASALLSGNVEVGYGSKRRIRYVYLDGNLILTLRPGDGLFSITITAGDIIRKATDPPRYRVIVKRGEIKGSVFASYVKAMDPALRPGDEAIVVDDNDILIGVGRVRVPANMINGLSRGEVVRLK